MSAFLSASAEPMSGLGAPCRTAIPIAERARSMRLPETIRPCRIRPSIASSERIARSPLAPLPISPISVAVDPQIISGAVPLARWNSGRRSSTTAFTPFENRPFIPLLLRLDDNAAVLHQCLVGLHRHHTRRRHHLAGLDVELTVMEVALDHVAVDVAFRQRARPVRTEVV